MTQATCQVLPHNPAMAQVTDWKWVLPPQKIKHDDHATTYFIPTWGVCAINISTSRDSHHSGLATSWMPGVGGTTSGPPTSAG